MIQFKNEEGFSLIELMIVISIMVITMSIMGYGVSYFSRASDSEQILTLNTSTRQALTLYYNLFANNPETTAILVSNSQYIITDNDQIKEFLNKLERYTQFNLVDQYKPGEYKMIVYYPNTIICNISFERI